MESSRRNRLEVGLHIVWATYKRQALVTPALEPDIYRVIEAEARSLNCSFLAIGGMPDHVHVVVLLPSTTTIARLLQQMKGVSSSVARDLLGPGGYFRWADGYAAFAMSPNHRQRAIVYVHRQKEHHARDRTWSNWEYVPEQSEANPVAERLRRACSPPRT
jgi:putative transposase